MTPQVYYWPRGDLILILSRNETHHRVWECDDTNFYWSDILDHWHEFELLGDL